MKAIITFNCHLEIDIDDARRISETSVTQRIGQLKGILLREFECERAEITGYQAMLVPYDLNCTMSK